eukprot:comp24304_c0_seq1/m.45646 comp24304_c0_seq1/g.45646  ORF comp24304_c0_seq1/g.45646 comp24304_c0_seq1/m.45646 type:complete len:574 (-) comp24304_c0_seq1:324-2045(-)
MSLSRKFLLPLLLACGTFGSETETTNAMPSQSNSTVNATVSPLLNQSVSLPPAGNITKHTCTNQDGVVTSSITTVKGVTFSWRIEGTQMKLNASFNDSTDTISVGVASGNSSDPLSLLGQVVVGDVINATVQEYRLANGTVSPLGKGSNETSLLNGTVTSENGTSTLHLIFDLAKSGKPTTLISASADNDEEDESDELLATAHFVDVNAEKCTQYRAPIKLTGVPGEPKVINHVCSVEDGNHVTKVSTKKPVTWTWHISNGTLYMNATYHGVFSGWFAAGFTSAPDQMFPASVMIGNMSTGTVEEYSLDGMTPNLVTKKANQSLLISGKAILSDNTTSISFVRKLNPGSGDFFNATGLVYSIWAGSNSSVLANGHKPDMGRGDFTTQLNLCSLTRPETNLTRIPGAPKVLRHTCAKKNGVVSSEIALAKGVTLNWTIVDDVINMTATLNHSAVGWFAVGFTDSLDQMFPSNAFIGNLSTGTVAEYSILSMTEVNMKANNTLLQSGSAALVSNTTVLSFSRKIDANAAKEYLVTKGRAYIIFAVGKSTELMAGHTPGLGRGDIMTELDICSRIL